MNFVKKTVAADQALDVSDLSAHRSTFGRAADRKQMGDPAVRLNRVWQVLHGAPPVPEAAMSRLSRG
jgi:hypothetical protein